MYTYPQQVAGRCPQEQKREGPQLPFQAVPLQHAGRNERGSSVRLPPHRGDVCQQEPLHPRRRRRRVRAGGPGGGVSLRLPLPVAPEVLPLSLQTTSLCTGMWLCVYDREGGMETGCCVCGT